MDYYLVDGRLPDALRHGAETYVTLSCLRDGRPDEQGVRMLPVLRGGKVHEIVELPAGFDATAFHSSSGEAIPAGHFSVRKLPWHERIVRMGYRVAAAYGDYSASYRRAIGLAPHRIVFDLADAYRAVSRLRFSWPLSRYEGWAERLDTLGGEDVEKILCHIGSLPSRPRFRVCLLASGSDSAALAASRDSLAGQLYREFSLAVLESAPRIDDLAAAEGEWLLLLRAGDRLAPHALYEFACAVLDRPQAALLYADDDVIDAEGRRREPRFKPDWSMTHLRSTNYVGTAFALRGSVLAAIGGGPYGEEETAPYDLLLRAGERLAEEEVVHVPRVLLHRSPAAVIDSAADDARDLTAVRAHLERKGVVAEVSRTRHGCRRVKYALPEHPPGVSIIVPTRDAVELLRQCVDSLLEKTAYPRFEILVVDNQSSDAATLDYFRTLSRHRNVRVLRYDRPFNYSAINNFAVREAHGELVCLLNNDTEVISPDWLEEMVGQLLQDKVGVVGAKLYYPDGRVQHAGDAVGPGGCANHLHSFIAREDPGYCNRAAVVQELSAVTAACLLTKKDLYERLGGLDEKHLPVAFNDVDYCLRVREAGYKVIWTPHAELYHHESVSRGKDKTLRRRLRAWREVRYMRRRWREAMKNDPFYNPNFSYERPDFVLGAVSRVERPWMSGFGK
ncbi:MAG: glycosyltransferase family 2 protein [Pseudomonadota bacterium]